MVREGYHFMIDFSIISNFYISVDSVYPGPSARDSIVSSELEGIWILSSP